MFTAQSHIKLSGDVHHASVFVIRKVIERLLVETKILKQMQVVGLYFVVNLRIFQDQENVVRSYSKTLNLKTLIN